MQILSLEKLEPPFYFIVILKVNQLSRKQQIISVHLKTVQALIKIIIILMQYIPTTENLNIY